MTATMLPAPVHQRVVSYERQGTLEGREVCMALLACGHRVRVEQPQGPIRLECRDCTSAMIRDNPPPL